MRKLRNLANIGLATLLAVSFTAVSAFAEDNVAACTSGGESDSRLL